MQWSRSPRSFWSWALLSQTHKLCCNQVVLSKAVLAGDLWTCTDCDYKHKRRGYLLNHIEKEHLPKSFPGYGCLRCEQVLNFMSKIATIFFQLNFVKVLDARYAFHIHMNKCSRLSKPPSKLPTHLTHLETRVARSVLFLSSPFFPWTNHFQVRRSIPMHRLWGFVWFFGGNCKSHEQRP